MKKIIGFMCLVLIAAPGCIPGNMADFPPPIHDDPPDTSLTVDTDMDTGAEGAYKTCINNATTPPGTFTCVDYTGSGFSHDDAANRCANNAGTYVTTAPCDMTTVIGYCTMDAGTENEWVVYYFDQWDLIMAQTGCMTDLQGDWTAGAPSNGNTYIGTCKDLTTAPGPGVCVEYWGRGFDATTAEDECSNINGVFHNTEQCEHTEYLGYCTLNDGDDDEVRHYYYTTDFDMSGATTNCTDQSGVWAGVASCSDTTNLTVGICIDFTGDFHREQAFGQTTTNGEFMCTNSFQGTFDENNICTTTDKIGTCTITAGEPGESNYNYYSTDWNDTDAQENCSGESGNWIAYP